jgi:hypothetical protein
MNNFFILIWVHRGFIQEPEIFKCKKDALFRKTQIQKRGFNSDYDEIDIFRKTV